MKNLVVANLKMNIVSPAEREKYFLALKKELKEKKLDETEIVLCPPAIHIEEFVKKLGKKVRIGAQNMLFEERGSFTGEISPLMLKNFGCEYVLVGHSERRRYFGETDEMNNHKILAAIKYLLKPILCVGETAQEKKSNQTMRVVSSQLRKSLNGMSKTKSSELTIAYEPIWAVGSDRTPTANEIMEAKLLIRKILVEIFDKKQAEDVKIIYGGSVSLGTVKEVCLNSEMKGALIGRESLIPSEFMRIAKIIDNC